MSAKNKDPVACATWPNQVHNTPVDSAGSALRQRAEAIFRRKAALSQENLADLTSEAAQLMLHELQVHQIELEMQNEELRQSHLALDAARTRYFDVLCLPRQAKPFVTAGFIAILLFHKSGYRRD